MAKSKKMEIRDRIKELRRVKAADLRPNPKNWRTHPKSQQDALRGILAEVGYADALLARELPDGGLMLVDGHLRAEATPDSIVPVLVLDVTEAEADKILATLDPLAAMAEADSVKLDALLATIDTESEALLKMLDEVAKDAGCESSKQTVDEDDVPEVPKTPVTKPGDLWLLGNHRLVCGDSTKAEDVARAMNGERADICFTSPPYGAGNVAKLRDHYEPGQENRKSFYDNHDDKPAEWLSLMGAWFAAARAVCDVVFCNVQLLADNKRQLVEWLYAYRDDLSDVIVWDKNRAAPQMQKNVLSNAWEFIFVLGGNGSRAIHCADFHGTIQNIVRIDPRGTNEFAGVHRAVMPIALPAWVIGTLCPLAKIILEPFAGTGTTIIAAEQLGRRCFGIELSPAYCDVIVERWQNLTGGKATRA